MAGDYCYESINAMLILITNLFWDLAMKSICISLLIFLVSGCSHTVIIPSDITNKTFPTVRGNSLDGQAIALPQTYEGKNTLLLIGYQQKTQFDIDRWILGILQAEMDVQIVEVPTIAGMMPQMVQQFIDNGMRSGIPQNDWASVVTVYEDADKIINFFGNERPQSALAVLIDKNSRIIWKSNLGYSASQILELKQIVSELK